jgi:pimeloyl-ACP methyl ester carboxylesterase
VPQEAPDAFAKQSLTWRHCKWNGAISFASLRQVSPGRIYRWLRVLIITHGWPGSIIEQTKVIGPLTDPSAHGASASDAFHLVIPSMPGYGYSPEPTTLGWDPVRIAKAWVVWMKRLGYNEFVAQGGDWGAAVTQQLALLAPTNVRGIHSNMPGTVPADVLAAATSGGAAPAGLSGRSCTPSSN